MSSDGNSVWPRAGVILLGAVLFLSGIPLLVTPGPGLAVMACGASLLVYGFGFRGGRSS